MDVGPVQFRVLTGWRHGGALALARSRSVETGAHQSALPFQLTKHRPCLSFCTELVNMRPLDST